MDKDNFMVQTTKENIEVIREWTKQQPSCLGGYTYNIGAYYGMKDGRVDAWSEDYYDNQIPLITFDEFKQNILNQPTGYEIY